MYRELRKHFPHYLWRRDINGFWYSDNITRINVREVLVGKRNKKHISFYFVTTDTLIIGKDFPSLAKDINENINVSFPLVVQTFWHLDSSEKTIDNFYDKVLTGRNLRTAVISNLYLSFTHDRKIAKHFLDLWIRTHPNFNAIIPL